jgi:hypothetical protein
MERLGLAAGQRRQRGDWPLSGHHPALRKSAPRARLMPNRRRPPAHRGARTTARRYEARSLILVNLDLVGADLGCLRSEEGRLGADHRRLGALASGASAGDRFALDRARIL